MADPSGDYTRLRVFVASSKDVSAEREIVRGVLNELNRTLEVLTPDRRVFLQYFGFDERAYPAAGRVQGVINDQVGLYDIFIGIMWTRCGPGTVEEFELAYERWQRERKPHIMFYVSTALVSPPSTTAELEEWSKVVAFRQRLEAAALIWKYDGATKFADEVRPHLMNVIAEIAPAKERAPQPEEPPRKRFGRRRRDTASPPPGASLKITEIAPDDAYYAMRKTLIGRRGRVRSLQATGDGWYGGLIELEQPLSDEQSLVPLYRFRWQT